MNIIFEITHRLIMRVEAFIVCVFQIVWECSNCFGSDHWET